MKVKDVIDISKNIREMTIFAKYLRRDQWNLLNVDENVSVKESPKNPFGKLCE